MDDECAFCLENMAIEHGLLHTDCCGKYVHIDCMLKACSKGDTSCMMCRQQNSFCVSVQPHSLNSVVSLESTASSRPTRYWRTALCTTITGLVVVVILGVVLILII